MKTHTNTPDIIWKRRSTNLFIIVAFCLLSGRLFAQALTIVSPSSNSTYQLPDPGTLLSPEATRGAGATAELAGRGLTADAANEKTVLANAENDLSKTQTMKSDYLAGLDNYNKNGLNPYVQDLNSYTPNMTRYNEILERHNAAVAASNALPADQRNANTVANLNSEKTELDNWHAKLNTWKSNLDNTKAKLDADRSVLLIQKQQYETAYQNAMDRIRASQLKLKAILDQLILCANYAEKCNGLLISKFNYTSSSATGFFGTPVYKGSIADLNTNLERIKSLSGKVWDGN